MPKGAQLARPSLHYQIREGKLSQAHLERRAAVDVLPRQRELDGDDSVAYIALPSRRTSRSANGLPTARHGADFPGIGTGQRPLGHLRPRA